MLVTSNLLLIFVLIAAIAELLLHHNRSIAILRLNLYNFVMLTAFQMQEITDVGKPTLVVASKQNLSNGCMKQSHIILKSRCAVAIGLHVNSNSSPPF